jgi:hypothetical protein
VYNDRSLSASNSQNSCVVGLATLVFAAVATKYSKGPQSSRLEVGKVPHLVSHSAHLAVEGAEGRGL